MSSHREGTQSDTERDTELIDLGRALSVAAVSVSADAAPFSGAQGQADLTVLLNSLKLLTHRESSQRDPQRGHAVITPNALCGTAALLRIATRLEGQATEAAAARRLRDGCCDVLRAAMGASAAAVPLLTRLLVLDALAESVSVLNSADAARSSPALPLFKQCLVSVYTHTEKERGREQLVAARVWRERSALNEASQRLLQKCQLQQVERILPSSVAAYAFEYATQASLLSEGKNTAALQQAVVVMNQHTERDRSDASGDDCWQRPPKRVRSTSSGAESAPVLSLSEMVKGWMDSGPAMVLAQVKQLLAAVEAQGVHELQRQLQQLECERASEGQRGPAEKHEGGAVSGNVW